jgi:hypothetical protein
MTFESNWCLLGAPGRCIFYYRVSHTYLTKVILLKMTLKCIVHLKGRHPYNHKDPPLDMNHQLMSADKCFVVNFDLKKRNWFLLFFLLFSTRNKDFLKMKQWNMVQVKLDRQKSLYFLHNKSFDSLFAKKIEKKSNSSILLIFLKFYQKC